MSAGAAGVHPDADAQRQRPAWPGRVPRGKPDQHGPGKSAVASAMTSRAGSPSGSSHPRISPNTSASRPRQDAAQPQLRQHAIDAVRTLVHVLDEEHAAIRRIEGVRRPERRDELRQRSAEQRAPRFARPQISSPRAQLESGAASLNQPHEGRFVVAVGPPARRPSSIGPWSAAIPALASARTGATCCRCRR